MAKVQVVNILARQLGQRIGSLKWFEKECAFYLEQLTGTRYVLLSIFGHSPAQGRGGDFDTVEIKIGEIKQGSFVPYDSKKITRNIERILKDVCFDVHSDVIERIQTLAKEQQEVAAQTITKFLGAKK